VASVKTTAYPEGGERRAWSHHGLEVVGWRGRGGSTLCRKEPVQSRLREEDGGGALSSSIHERLQEWPASSLLPPSLSSQPLIPPSLHRMVRLGHGVAAV
jgi:hypothetical protein